MFYQVVGPSDPRIRKISLPPHPALFVDHKVTDYSDHKRHEKGETKISTVNISMEKGLSPSSAASDSLQAYQLALQHSLHRFHPDHRTMFAFATTISISSSTRGRNSSCSRRRQAPSMGPWKKGEKDEAFRQQQEILARRRDRKRSKQYFEDVGKRRDEVEEYFDNRTLKVKDGEDPIIAWKKMKDDGFIDEGGYTEEDEGGIIIPMASFGIPKYDRGARFDLKLPHVEHGYADEDADIMRKAGKALKNLFGFGNSDQQSKSDK